MEITFFVVTNSAGYEVRSPGFKSWLYHLLPELGLVIYLL